MVDIPDSLRSVFSATVVERDGRYFIEVPSGDVAHDAVKPGETYRVGLLDVTSSTASSGGDAVTSGTPATASSKGDAVTTAIPATENTEQHETGSGSPGSHRGASGTLPEPPVDEGEIREVTIESVGDQGDGIAKVERGFVVIVSGASVGEQPTIEIERVRENVAFASVREDGA